MVSILQIFVLTGVSTVHIIQSIIYVTVMPAGQEMSVMRNVTQPALHVDKMITTTVSLVMVCFRVRDVTNALAVLSLLIVLDVVKQGILIQSLRDVSHVMRDALIVKARVLHAVPNVGLHG